MKNRTFVITGAGSGFGRATALKLAAEGARLVLGDLNTDTAARTAKEARAAGAEAMSAKVDVAEEDSVEAFTANALQAFGRIDGAFNSAGVLGPVGPMVDVSAMDFDRVMAINARGVWLCMQAQIRAMTRENAGAPP